MAVALVQRLFGRQRRSLCLAASVPGFLLSGASPWMIKEISEEIWPFSLYSCLPNSSCRTVKFVMLTLNSVCPHESGFVSNRKSSWWTQTSRRSSPSTKLWIDHPTASKGQGPQTSEPAQGAGTCTYHALIDLSPRLPTDCKQRWSTEMRAKHLHSVFHKAEALCVLFSHAPFVTYKIKRCQTTRII